jgi:hypothetical protein
MAHGVAAKKFKKNIYPLAQYFQKHMLHGDWRNRMGGRKALK